MFPVSHAERRWLTILIGLTVVELAWWYVCWMSGIAPAPHLGTYVALSGIGMAAALILRLALRPGADRASWPVLLLGTILIAVGASLFLPLKYAIPHEVRFWLDRPLAVGERHIFGNDPWRIADQMVGWARAPLDRLYGFWLPVQSLVLFSVMLSPASAAKSRALIAYGLAWFLLGVVAAVLCASAGPIFYDRLLDSHDFDALASVSRADAWVTRGEADAMWASFQSGRPGLVAGISAMPSLHVAISFWIWLTARSIAPSHAPLALAYTTLIWFASVQLGWHYMSDGLVGGVGMAAIWWLADKMVPRDDRNRNAQKLLT